MIELNYRNCLVSAVGNEGISEEKLESLKKDAFKALDKVKENPPGFMELPLRFDVAKQMLIDAGKYRDFENFVILGIGGSALGNITLQNALNGRYYNLKKKPRFFVLDNVDPYWTEELAEVIDPSKTLFNVITKSGSTAETLSNFFYFLDKLKNSSKNWKDNLVFTTGAKGFLREFADENGIKTYPVPENVGGRYSVLSEVGLFPAAVCGIDTVRLLEGAADAMENEHVPAEYAALQYYFYSRGKNISVFMPYSKRLEMTADWFRQLWAESLGKEGKGPTPVKALGTTDQHSQIQLYMEGPKDKIITFLDVKDAGPELKLDFEGHFLGGKSIRELFKAEYEGTRMALAEVKRPSMTFELPAVDEYNMGELIYQLEMSCCLMGNLMGINPFDQPGVELGKKLAYRLMGKEG